MAPIETLARRYPRKRVMITGATSGLGEALALLFAGAGFRVGVASRNPEKVDVTCERVASAGGEPLPITLDVNREEDFRAAAARVEEAWDGLDILVNNAGILTSGKMEDIGIEEWQKSIDTDLWGVIHGCRILIPLLNKSGGGHIANIASAAGLMGAPDLASYCVAKAGVVSLSESLAVELVAHNIDVTVSCPTVFKSHLMDDQGHDPQLMTGVTAEGLKRDMASSSVSSGDVAEHLVKCMARRRMFSVPQRDARIQWWLSRMFPESFRKLLLFLYRRRLWVFNDGS